MTEQKRISFSPPDITQAELDEVADALRSGWITTGPKTKEFEREIALFAQAERSACAKRAISRSNSFVFGPVVIQPLLSASATSSSSACVMSGGENEMRFCSVTIAPWYPVNGVRPA